MQYQVPQFIETEDRIVGPLTLKQFAYIASSAALSFFLYFTVSKSLWFILSVFIVGGGIALAVIKVNGQSLPTIAKAAARFFWQPQLYTWQPEDQSLPKNDSTMRGLFGKGIDLEKIVSGFSLRNTWREVQTGKAKNTQESSAIKYEIIRRKSGDRKVARRVDYS
jgi:hypothetical protein